MEPTGTNALLAETPSLNIGLESLSEMRGFSF